MTTLETNLKCPKAGNGPQERLGDRGDNSKRGQTAPAFGPGFCCFLVKLCKNRQWTRTEASQVPSPNFHRMAIRSGA